MSLRSNDDPQEERRSAGQFPIVGIGASAGGLEAFSQLGLPKLNGYEAARRIREKSGKNVMLVALTEQAGFDAHLVKPVAPEALNRLLASLDDRPTQTVAAKRTKS